jgi:hypothetical protein
MHLGPLTGLRDLSSDSDRAQCTFKGLHEEREAFGDHELKLNETRDVGRP